MTVFAELHHGRSQREAGVSSPVSPLATAVRVVKPMSFAGCSSLRCDGLAKVQLSGQCKS
jgi:hypothetical protein